jgi:hypothetical protein
MTQMTCCGRPSSLPHSLPARPHAAGYRLDAETIPADQAQVAEQQLLTAERHGALREAFAHLSPCCQELIVLLIQDPPVPYATISASLGIPVGSIGPNRSPLPGQAAPLSRLAALINAEGETCRRQAKSLFTCRRQKRR